MPRPATSIPVSVDFTGVTVPPPQTPWTAPLPVCSVAPVVEISGPTQITWELSSPNVPAGYTLVFGTTETEHVEPIAFAAVQDADKTTTVWTGPRPQPQGNTAVTLLDTDTQVGTFEYTVWYLLVRNSDQARTLPVLKDPDIQNKGGGGKKLVITP